MKLKELVTMTTRTQKFVIREFNRYENFQTIYNGFLEESDVICEYEICLIETDNDTIIVYLDNEEGEKG